jgi:hypothetical protein
MAQKTEKLSQELIDDLRGMQTKANELIIGIGQSHLKLKNFKIEMTKLMEEQKSMELEFELNDSKFTTAIRDLEKKYPMGELDLNEGIVIYESAE